MKILGWLYFKYHLDSAIQIHMSGLHLCLGIQFIHRSCYLLNVSTSLDTGISNVNMPEQSSIVHVQWPTRTCASSSLPSLSKWILLTTPYKRFGFPSSRFFSCNATPGLCRCHLALSVSPCETGAQETSTKNADTLAPAIAGSNKLSFILHPGVSCLLPARTKPWRPKLIACS